MKLLDQRKWSKVVSATLTWHPVYGGTRSLVWWQDDLTVELGDDRTGTAFAEISQLAISGNYYPPSVIQFDGTFRSEGRNLRVGDRVLQTLQLGPLPLWSGVEIFLARCENDECEIGYVTTSAHHGRGIWQARIFCEDGKVMLNVKSKAGPQSWAFWLGLPLARFLQKRARRLAVERFQEMCFWEPN